MYSSAGNNTLILLNNKFISNAALIGGSVYCYNCSYTIVNNSFSSGVARLGGDIYIHHV